MRLPFGPALAAFALAGCAKFPPGGAASGFTRLSFHFTMAQSIDPNYVYVVAIRPIFDSNPAAAVDGNGPIPVVLNGSKNGFVEGWPTRFVRYEESTTELYNVYQFPPRVPTTDDTNPRNLGAQVLVGGVIAGSGVDPRPAANGGTAYGRDLGFDIDTRYLADTQDQAQHIVSIQFNILTMNKTALNSTGDRVMDALGDTRSAGTISFNDYQTRSIVSGATYTNTQSSEPEGPNDTFNGTLPAVDIVDWTLEVRTP